MLTKLVGKAAHAVDSHLTKAREGAYPADAAQPTAHPHHLHAGSAVPPVHLASQTAAQCHPLYRLRKAAVLQRLSLARLQYQLVKALDFFL